jgi:hypothetical protein
VDALTQLKVIRILRLTKLLRLAKLGQILEAIEFNIPSMGVRIIIDTTPHQKQAFIYLWQTASHELCVF